MSTLYSVIAEGRVTTMTYHEEDGQILVMVSKVVMTCHENGGNNAAADGDCLAMVVLAQGLCVAGDYIAVLA